MSRGKFGYPGVYNSSAITLDDGEGAALAVNANGELIVNLETADIQIGSVELKDSDSTALANIKAANTARTTATVVVATQPIDAAGAVLSTSALATEVTLGTIDTDTGNIAAGYAAEAAALGSGVLLQGDDGTDRKNVNVDATTGDVQVDVTNTVTVSATDLDIRDLTATDVVTANLSATDNAVLDTIDAVLDTINAKLVTGTDIGDVTINNSTGAAAVNIQDGGNTITVDGTVAVTNAGTFAVQVDGAALTALQLLDDAIYATDGALSKSMVVGAIFDDTSPVAITENQGGYLRMSSRRALLVEGVASGTAINVLDTNSASALTALQLIDNAISGAGFNITQLGGAAVPIGAGLEATAVRVTLPTDGTGVVKLGAGTAGIGKLTANSGVDIGDVDILSIAAGDNNIGNVDIASIAAGTNAIGKLAANSGIDIGDVDILSIIPGGGATNLGKAEDAAHTSGDTGVFALGVRNDTPNVALAGTDLDYSPIAVYRTGALRVAPPEEDFAALGSNSVKKYYTNAGAVTDGIIWSPAAGKRWYVTDIFINVSAAATVTLEDDLAGGDSAVWKAELAANSGWSHHFGTPLFSGEDAADLIITTSAANVYVTCVGYEI